MKCTVSVIIPAYNCHELVGQAIQSILDQTHRDLEILISDDGSTDCTRSVIDSFRDDRIKALHNQKNLGYLKTVNRLFGLATGEYICFQDADDWSAPNRIELQLNAITLQSVEACGTGIYYTTLKGKNLERIIYPKATGDVRRCILEGLPSACYASILFSRNILKSIGGYREFFVAGAEDVDWLLRLSEKYEFTNLEAPLYFYRFSPTSITQSTSVLKLKASLKIVREMAVQREAGLIDDLQAGNISVLQQRWNQIFEQLGAPPLAEDLHKINMLLKRHANWECVKLCLRMLGKDAPLRSKALIISSTVVKLVLGLNRYHSIKSHIHKVTGKKVPGFVL